MYKKVLTGSITAHQSIIYQYILHYVDRLNNYIKLLDTKQDKTNYDNANFKAILRCHIFSFIRFKLFMHDYLFMISKFSVPKTLTDMQRDRKVRSVK